MIGFRKTKLSSVVCIIVALSFLTGCAQMQRHAAPKSMRIEATLSGMNMAGIRTYGDAPSKIFQEDIAESLRQESSSDFLVKGVKNYPIVAISGGSANGAYGAGLLKGWTEHGTRPEFKAVTGISTGALIAPFAFLGSKWDGVIEDLYTTMSTKDVMRSKGPIAALTGDSFATNRPLEKIIERQFSMEILKKIAIEHKKGKRLYIGTTNLDSQRLVVWNMGAIALEGNYQALDLSRKILLASAAIPIAFPPVFFDVEVDGKHYNEMHVDGGTITQQFGLYGIMQGMDKGKDVTMYVIRNGYVVPRYKEVEDKIPAIAESSINAMIWAQSLAGLYILQKSAEARGHDFNLAYIPGHFKSTKEEEFDPNEMKDLFELGEKQAKAGYPWAKEAPLFGKITKK